MQPWRYSLVTPLANANPIVGYQHAGSGLGRAREERMHPRLPAGVMSSPLSRTRMTSDSVSAHSLPRSSQQEAGCPSCASRTASLELTGAYEHVRWQPGATSAIRSTHAKAQSEM